MSSSDAGAKMTPNKPSVRSRMTSLVRRSSTALSFTRPGTSSRRSSSESLAVDTHQTLGPPNAVIGHELPSPVPESPAVGPTPIVSATPAQANYRSPSAPIDIPVKTPPPHNNWGDGPVTITPSAISSPAVTARSEGVEISLAMDVAHSSAPGLPESVKDELSMDGVSAIARAQRAEDDPTPPYITQNDVDEHLIEEGDVVSTQTDEGPHTEAHFAGDTGPTSGEEAPSPNASLSNDEHVELMDAFPASGVSPEVSAVDLAHVGAAASVHATPSPSLRDMSLVRDVDPTLDTDRQPILDGSAIDTQRTTPTVKDIEGGRSRGFTVSPQSSPLTPPATFTRTNASAKTSIASSAEHTMPVEVDDHPYSDASTSSIPLYEDPFADPMPVPETSTHVYSPDRAAFQSPMDARPSDSQSLYSIPVSMAMPAAHVPLGVQGDSQWNDSTGPGYVDDERLPLLRGSSQAPVETVTFPQPIRLYGAAPPVELDFERLGWLMHVLPDMTVYFTHVGLSIVTDIDLRTEDAMRDVSRYLGGPRVRPPAGWELWLRSTGKLSARSPEHFFVRHEKHMVVPVSYDPEPNEPSAVELLAMQASYWMYIEKHPAHVILSPTTSAEATDILTWAYTDRLLPPVGGKIPPFSQDECHELSAILRSLDANLSPNHVTIRTRVIAKIMLRICRWKQGHISVDDYGRPSNSRSNVWPSFVRRIADVAISAACLGVPYLFFDRSRSRRDYESGMRSTAGSILVVGAVACMTAAVILGASVTLISIPGLNDISRIASFICIILSASSLVSAFLALFRWKTDIERSAYPGVGHEGFMVLSRRSVLLSLPLVFLIWAIAAFVVGVALHMLKGLVLPRHVGKYMQCAIVGTVGGLAGILFACGLLLL